MALVSARRAGMAAAQLHSGSSRRYDDEDMPCLFPLVLLVVAFAVASFLFFEIPSIQVTCYDKNENIQR